MPQTKPKVDWCKNTHLPPPVKEPVRIDNSDVKLENEQMERNKNDTLLELHLEKHRTIMDRTAEIKQAKQDASMYSNYRKTPGLEGIPRTSCLLLVRRSKSENKADESIEQIMKNQKLKHSNSWSYVSSRIADRDTNKAMPFSRDPIKMRYIPSVTSPDAIEKRTQQYGKVRQQIRKALMESEEYKNRNPYGRSYKTLKELTDIDKIGKIDREAEKSKLWNAKRYYMGQYNESLKDKVAQFHQDIDNYKEKEQRPNIFLQPIKKDHKIY